MTGSLRVKVIVAVSPLASVARLDVIATVGGVVSLDSTVTADAFVPTVERVPW
jgi:hypothetical protein